MKRGQHTRQLYKDQHKSSLPHFLLDMSFIFSSTPAMNCNYVCRFFLLVYRFSPTPLALARLENESRHPIELFNSGAFHSDDVTNLIRTYTGHFYRVSSIISVSMRFFFLTPIIFCKVIPPRRVQNIFKQTNIVPLIARS